MISLGIENLFRLVRGTRRKRKSADQQDSETPLVPAIGHEDDYDEIEEEWGAAFDARLSPQTQAPNNSEKSDGNPKSLPKQNTGRSKGTKVEDEPLRSYVDMSNNKIICEMKSGKVRHLGILIQKITYVMLHMLIAHRAFRHTFLFLRLHFDYL